MISSDFKKLLAESADFLRRKYFTYDRSNKKMRYLRTLYHKYIHKMLLRMDPLLGTSMMIALTYRCQCRCRHCSASLYNQGNKDELNSGEVYRLIDEAKRLRFREIYFFGGEPLLVPDLTNYIKYTGERSLITRLDTNGYLLNESMAKKLKNSGIDLIGVSIDSPYEDIHDRLRGIRGIFKRAIEGIKYCRKYNIECYISTYATKSSLRNGELKKTIAMGRSLGVRVRILSSIQCGSWLKREDLVLTSEDISILRNLLRKNRVYWDSEYVDFKNAPFRCVAVNKGFFYVSAYGDVQPCCFIPVSFGNIRTSSLDAIVKKMWASDMFKWFTANDCHDCPMNNEKFRVRYKNLLQQGISSYPS